MSDKAAEDFMHDQLEALLASPALSRVAKRHSEDGEQPVAAKASTQESDAQSSRDVQPQRETSPEGLKP